MSQKLLQMLRSAEYWRLAWMEQSPAYQRGGECGDAVKYLKYCPYDRKRALRNANSGMMV